MRRSDTRIELRNEPVGPIAKFAQMQIVKFRIHFGRGRYRRPAQRRDLAGQLGAPMNVANLRCLNMHAADHHGVGPGELGFGCGRNIFVNNANLPGGRHVGSNYQEPLGRHEGPDAPHQPISMLKRAE